MTEWQLIRFADFCTLKKGRKPHLFDERPKNGQPYLTARYMRGTEAPQFVNVDDRNAVFVQPSEIIIICDGSNSGETFTGFEGALSSTMATVSHGDVVTTDFLRFFLISQIDKYAETKTGAAIPHLDLKGLKDSTVPVPPLPEQKRIVAILDEAFEGIAKATANAERNLANARELFDASLRACISDASEGAPKRTLAQIAKQFGRGKSKHRPRNDPKLYGGPYPFIQTGDVRNAGHYITTHTQTYSDAGLRQSKLWPSGTICITIAANIAETGILTFDACFPDSVIGIVVDETNANPDYVEFLLQYFKVSLKAEGKGSAQDNINLGTFEELEFPVPTLDVQNEIVDRLNMLDEQSRALMALYEAQLASLVELKKSALHKAFSGQLTGKEVIAA